MKFQKKPVIVEAVQWTGENVNDIRAILPNESMVGFFQRMLLPTDWLVKPYDGNAGVVSDADFKVIYEPYYENHL